MVQVITLAFPIHLMMGPLVRALVRDPILTDNLLDPQAPLALGHKVNKLPLPLSACLAAFLLPALLSLAWFTIFSPLVC